MAKTTTAEWRELERMLDRAPPPLPLDLAGAAEPVQRYFRNALGETSSPARGMVLTMRGQIKIGRWFPFRARQLLAPRFGTVWEASVARVITGSDRYVAGVGGMSWRLLGVLPFIHAEGPDVTRSAAERAAGESLWAPSAVAPGTGTAWAAMSHDRIGADIETDGHHVRVEHEIDQEGRLLASSFPRWGDPDRSGKWGLHPFGVSVLGHRTFGSLTIPTKGEAGWHHGTPRWAEGAFFRFEITSAQQVP